MYIVLPSASYDPISSLSSTEASWDIGTIGEREI